MDIPLELSQSGMITSALCVTLVGLALTTYYRYKNLSTYWSEKGVGGPNPIPIIGNLHQMLLGDRGKQGPEWGKKYGKFYGIFRGKEPVLMIADAELIRQICIKDFDAFPNHHVNDMFNKYQKSFIFMLQDDHWRRVRALMSPTFTSGKIKRMFRLLDGCADDLVKCFAEQFPAKTTEGARESAVVNVKDTYSLFALDAISTCCYGLKLEREGSVNLKTAATRNDLVKIAMKLFDFSIVRVLLAASVPQSLLKSLGFQVTPERNMMPLLSRVERLIQGRRASDKKFDDYLQLLLDAKLEQELELDELDSEENHHAGLTHESLQADQKQMVLDVEAKENARTDTDRRVKVSLSDLEITTGAMFLLVVGLETTATLLAHCAYALAFHQDIQQRLYDEVKALAEYNEGKRSYTFEYAKLTTCQYLDSVISETLRLLSPIPEMDRVTSREYLIEKYNVRLPKKATCLLGMRAVHMDLDYWKEPEKFDPERFMPGNRENIVPGSYFPFGLGPRHCLGMRFSLTESKLALAKTLMSYRIEPAPGLSFPPETRRWYALYNIRTPLVTIVKRTHSQRE